MESQQEREARVERELLKECAKWKIHAATDTSTDPVESRLIEEVNRLRLLEQRDTARMNARLWFACFCVVSALWVLREVAR